MAHGKMFTNMNVVEHIDWPYDIPSSDNHMQEFANNVLLDSGNPYLIHKEGSPYLGLPLYKQKVLAKIRRGGTRTKKHILKRMKKATKEDYTKLLLRCIETYIAAWEDSSKRLDRITVLLKLPFNFRKLYKNKEFPRVVIIGYEDWSVFVSVKVDSLVDYLYLKGNSPFNSKDMRKQLWSILQEQHRLNWYYEYAAPISIVECYSGIIEDAKVGNIQQRRSEKGRGRFSKYRKRKKAVDKT